LFGACVYAFCTCVWSIASKAIWQHGPSLLLITAALLIVTSTRSRAWLLIAGVFLGLAIWNRATNAIFVVAILGWWCWRVRRLPVPLALGLVPPIACMLAYSWVYLARVDTFGQLQSIDTFSGDPRVGFIGLLVSPNRGLFVFSPVLLLSVAGAIIAVRRPRTYSLAVALGVAVLLELLVYSRWYFWWGGATFGYRLIVEMIPALVVLAAIGWQEWARGSGARILGVAALALVSVYIQWLGATYYPCGFDTEPNGIDQHPERLWDVADGEISRCTATAAADATVDLDRTGVLAMFQHSAVASTIEWVLHVE
jgi:hypothetical protein